MVDAPEKIRVAQDSDGFWTCREAVSGSQEYVRADLVAELEALVETLKREAQQHAQEARTANATIAEIYQAVTGGSGEPGNWQGAEPIKAELTRLREALKLAEQMMTKSSLCDDERLDEGLSVIRRALKEKNDA